MLGASNNMGSGKHRVPDTQFTHGGIPCHAGHPNIHNESLMVSGYEESWEGESVGKQLSHPEKDC